MRKSEDELRKVEFPGFEAMLPKTLAARLECLDHWLNGIPVVDDNGTPTGERSCPLITMETYLRLLHTPPLSGTGEFLEKKIHKFMNHKEAVCETEYSWMDREREECTNENGKVTCRTCRAILKIAPMVPPISGAYIRQ